jgi:nucleoside-triphosphatase
MSRESKVADRAVLVHPWLMLTAVPRILLTGPPHAGKTTLVSRLADELTADGVAVGGLLTREMREDGNRVGFTAEEIGGPRVLLAHVSLHEGPMVGRYHVDVAAFESLALPAIQRALQRGGVVIIDELGQMELFSPAFIDSVNRLLDQPVPLVATIHARQHPVTDAIKQRPDTELLEIHPGHADELLAHLASRLSRRKTPPAPPDR